MIKDGTIKSIAKKQPRYQSVLEILRLRLREGGLTAGEKLPALRTLATEFEVSTNTIRKAIRMLEREGCLYRVPDLGTFVRPTYSTGTSTREIKVAFCTIDFASPFDRAIAQGIEHGGLKKGWTIRIVDARNNVTQEGRNLQRLLQSGMSGAIIMSSGYRESVAQLFMLETANIPIVLVDRAVPELHVDFVESNHEKGGYLATRHLIQHGHRRVLLVFGIPTLSSLIARIHGYERALMDNGLKPLKEWRIWIDPAVQRAGVQEQQRHFGAYRAALSGLKRYKPPMAIFAHDSYSGWGVYEACRKLGLNIPEDVSVVCFDDSDITQAISPPVTIIAQHTREIGEKAIELLERRLQGGNHDPEHVVVDVDLIPRNSVASPSPSRLAKLI